MNDPCKSDNYGTGEKENKFGELEKLGVDGGEGEGDENA